MKKDKMLFSIKIILIITAIIDFAFLGFFISQTVLTCIGSSFIYSYFWLVALIIIILNFLFICYTLVYIFIRKRK